jgi:protein-S-isoprenylcysteine O-methyltransferase Ste14
MEKDEFKKHVIGYAVGFSVFLLVIPVFIYISSEFFGFFPLFLSKEINYLISIPLFLIGIIFAFWSNIDLFRIGKGGPTDVFGIALSPRTKKLVISGPYRYTRNPMVFGMNAIYFSLAIFLNSWISMALVALFLLIIIVYLKFTEEKRLMKDFGEKYLEYKRKVPMIFPLPKRRGDKKIL